MSPLLTLISPFPYLNFPNSFLGWFGFILLAVCTITILWSFLHLNRSMTQGRWLLLISLLIATPFASLFFGFRLVQSEVIPPTGLSDIAIEPISMVFSAIPWVLAAGLFGPFSAAGLGFLSGLLLGLWNTHTLFASVEIALLAAIFSVCVRQRYRTKFYSLLRHPLCAAILIILIFAFNHFLVQLVLSEGRSLDRLDFTFQNLSNATLAFTISLLIAAVFAELISLLAPRRWIEATPLTPSPSERSLQMRFSQKMAPFAAALLIVLVVGDWIIAGNAAREMIDERMINAAELSSNGIPIFLEVGENLITQLAADQTFLSDQPAELKLALTMGIKTIPFFNQLAVIGPENEVVSSYPSAYYLGNQSPIDEQLGIQLAFDGKGYQLFTIPPVEGQKTAQFSFIAPILGEDGAVQRVLIGRSDLDTNPYAQPILSGFESLNEADNIAMLVDKDGQILYHTDPNMVMTTFSGTINDHREPFEETQPNGMRMLVRIEPVKETDWTIILMVPVYQAQQSAMDIAIPLLVMIAFLTVLTYVGLRYGLKSVTDSLDALAKEVVELPRAN